MTEKSSSSPEIPLKISMLLTLTCFVTDVARRSNGTISRSFTNIFKRLLRFPPNERPVNGVKTIDITIDSTINLWFRLFIPSTNETQDDEEVSLLLPVVIFFHGGAFTFFSPDFMIYDRYCRCLARKLSVIIVSVNYRPTPEYRCPAQYEDGFRCLTFLDDKSNFTGLPANADLTQCFLAGDSSGGNLAHNVACRASETEFRELKVIGLIAIQPWFGGEERTESEIRLNKRVPAVSIDRSDWHWKVFLPEGCDRDHEAANVFGPKASRDIAELKKFPAALVVIGGFDPLQDWQRRYLEGLKRGGKEVEVVEYPNSIHVFYCFRQFPESTMMIMEMKKFIKKQRQLQQEEGKRI